MRDSWTRARPALRETGIKSSMFYIRTAQLKKFEAFTRLDHVTLEVEVLVRISWRHPGVRSATSSGSIYIARVPVIDYEDSDILQLLAVEHI